MKWSNHTKLFVFYGSGGANAKITNMYYILFYKTIDDYVEKRAPYRNEHLRLAEIASENGFLVMAGALADPPDGAILIFKGDSPKIADEFAKNDPYVKNGLISEWYVRPWKVVIGDN